MSVFIFNPEPSFVLSNGWDSVEMTDAQWEAEEDRFPENFWGDEVE